jgi:hypothetical protein
MGQAGSRATAARALREYPNRVQTPTPTHAPGTGTGTAAVDAATQTPPADDAASLERLRQLEERRGADLQRLADMARDHARGKDDSLVRNMSQLVVNTSPGAAPGAAAVGGAARGVFRSAHMNSVRCGRLMTMRCVMNHTSWLDDLRMIHRSATVSTRGVLCILARVLGMSRFVLLTLRSTAAVHP